MWKEVAVLSVLSVCEKNVSAFSCNSEILQYQQIIRIKYCDEII